ncbi:hypothetical protein OESDEN_05651 [Oesophagostomum dentatum]|uniref:CHK kinase-like domain-containing protein n=1 Tax=Oesophagostomum dentatum TaxID=61180 RepID=A0A0B1TG85_OESDE|nr:hypothetical protein OESDEN_05651 [Oesophagostomum dentatum]
MEPLLHFSDSNKELISKSGPQLLSICRSLLAAMPEKLSCIKVFLSHTFDEDPNFMLTFREKYSNGEKTSVLVHGDLWAGQIFFRNEVDIAGIVDWQAAHLGSPVSNFSFVHENIEI